MASSFRLYLLGGFRLQRDGQPVSFARRKAGSLLAYLALHPEEHAREKIAALFWGDSTDADARRALRVTLTDLRRVLGEKAFLGERDTLQLNPAFPIWVDAIVFMAIGDWRSDLGIANLQSLLALYNGDLLSDFYDDWLTPMRAELRELYLSGLLLGVVACRSQSEYQQAITFAQKILATDRAQEQAHQHLIFCYAALGDRNAALQQFDDCQRALREELGIEPSIETQALVDQIRKQTQAVSPAAHFTNLPRPLTSFVGRKKETQELKDLLIGSGSAGSLLTLTGVGGSGKTRLAIQVARDMVEAYADGIWWVDLSPLSSEQLITQTIVKVLGVAEKPGCDLNVLLREFIRARHLLLVIDNCEHLRSACAVTIEDLLTHGPRLQILITSREALNVAGELTYPVSALTLPPANMTSIDHQSLLAFEAIKLFVNRAALHLSAFRLTDQNALLVSQICRRLEGLPLALELAAAQLAGLTLEALLTRLEERLDLTRQHSDGQSRQQTLRAVIDWSYGLLNDAEKILFRRLAVFAGGWTLEQATVVAAGYPSDDSALAPRATNQTSESILLPVTGAMVVQAILTSLIDKSLIQQRQTETGARYSMLETVREFAEQKLLELDEAKWVAERHYDFFAQFAEDISEVVGNAKADRLLQVAEQEHDNLRTAIHWALEQDSNAQLRQGLSVRLTGALWSVWNYRGYVQEVEAWLEQALKVCPPSFDMTPIQQRQRARALSGLGTMLCVNGDYARGVQLHFEALALFRVVETKRGVALTLNNIANAYSDIARYAEAQTLLEEGLSLIQDTQESAITALLLINLGTTLQYQGDLDQARRRYLEATEISRTKGLKVEMCSVQTNLGDLAMLQGDLDSALSHYAESLELARELEHKILISANLIFAGLALCLANRADEAVTNCQQALQLSYEMDFKSQAAECLTVLGLVAEKQNQPQLAIQFLSVSTALCEAIHYTFYPVMQAPYNAALESLRAKFPTEFEPLWAKSQALTLDDAEGLVAAFWGAGTAQNLL